MQSKSEQAAAAQSYYRSMFWIYAATGLLSTSQHSWFWAVLFNFMALRCAIKGFK